MELIAENGQLKLYYDNENHWLYADWFGRVKDELVKEGLDMIAKGFESKQTSVLLNDNTNLLGTWTGVIQWIINDWYPRALKAGYKKVAFIYSPDAFTKFSVDALRKQDKDSPVEQMSFKNISEAKNWLQTESKI